MKKKNVVAAADPPDSFRLRGRVAVKYPSGEVLEPVEIFREPLTGRWVDVGGSEWILIAERRDGGARVRAGSSSSGVFSLRRPI